MVSVSITSVLRLNSNGARVNFVVEVVVVGGNDLLLGVISGVWTGDICDDAERVDARLMVISPSVLPKIGGVGVGLCVCVVEAAVRTNVRRLIWRFPKPVCSWGSQCSSAALHSTCTGRAVAVFRPYRPVVAVCVAGAKCVTVRVCRVPVSLTVVEAGRLVCP
ncbi:Uncharacterized protein FWK35_00034498 [Aphis craccivora]|uniref:Uncharacterized protein n=1 Tax=Aphis craccivora TaxID=307492 RepID=A0A6G0VJA5_APHCR|nr:Uncharacterized protein FWK35_00034498 [Aphis craccivora]